MLSQLPWVGTVTKFKIIVLSTYYLNVWSLWLIIKENNLDLLSEKRWTDKFNVCVSVVLNAVSLSIYLKFCLDSLDKIKNGPYSFGE